MHPSIHAAVNPEKVALVDGDTGMTMTYGQLDNELNRWATELRTRGVTRGDRVAIMLPNIPEFFSVIWAVQSIGVEYTPINSHLTASEVARIILHSGARTFISSVELLDVVSDLGAEVDEQLAQRYFVDGSVEGWHVWPELRATHTGEPIADPSEGMFLYYSSGSTGAPKGILRGELIYRPLGESPDPLTLQFLKLVDFRPDDIMLSSAPLYHSAPLGWTMGVTRLGGTVVFTGKFEPRQTLELIERYRVTHSHMVPTMFVRLLKLDGGVRRSYDRSSVRAIAHSAAPCPVEIKRKMIAEWGEIIHEYYTSTELIGVTFITASDWLEHPGSVGRAIDGWGIPHIVDEQKNELPAGTAGELWFEGKFPFTYFGDTTALKSQRDEERSWATAGDIGSMDEDGYIYLTDRKAFMIISGGVNIFPQEIEAALILHPAVADVAVFGVPNPDFGEEVKAAIQPAPGVTVGPALAAELEAHCRRELAGYKVPRSFDFHESLPRLDTGKLYKSELRDAYWKQAHPK
ncbi:AMP-binding protein [Aminobacter sp. MSH1]|uniref:AMP-binding protein n=1 Tax=Aminobacter sp. MSH1 TaxID=374606 RepID=UPI000D36D022|nr:AMP-binding protein [Aminobacter sp. MSH1]